MSIKNDAVEFGLYLAFSAWLVRGLQTAGTRKIAHNPDDEMEGQTEFYFYRANGTRGLKPLNPNNGQGGIKFSHAAVKRAARGRLAVLPNVERADGADGPSYALPGSVSRTLFPTAAHQD